MRRITMILTLLMLTAAIAFAANEPTSGMSYSGKWFNGTDAASTVFAQGGTYTFLNLTLNEQTNNWAVLYGQIDSILLFRGGGGVVAFEWGSSEPGADYVFFSPFASPDWDNIIAAPSTDSLDDEDTALGLAGADPDSVVSTFNDVAAQNNNPLIDITASSVLAGTTFSVETNDDVGAFWHTSFVYDSTQGAGLYAGIVSENHNSFDGKSVDYQVMIPTPAAGNRTYYMFISI